MRKIGKNQEKSGKSGKLKMFLNCKKAAEKQCKKRAENPEMPGKSPLMDVDRLEVIWFSVESRKVIVQQIKDVNQVFFLHVPLLFNKIMF